MEARGLVKRFGTRTILDALDLSIERGERVALLGLNGAGKTTLLRCVMGVLSFEGDIHIGGLAVAQAGAQARGLIGYVPQRAPLFHMTLGETVELFASLRGVPAEAIAARLDALEMPLETTAELSLRELSGGMVQKALLAIALAADPAVLLLDEPSANLDPKARAEFMRALKRVGPDTTILLASHRLDEVELIAERIWILHGGGLVFDGPLDELRDRAGADSWLWVRTEAGRRDALRDELAGMADADEIVANGTSVGVRLTAPERTSALSQLRDAGVPIVDFWVERASLEDIVNGFFERREG